MLARGVSILLTDTSLAWVVFIHACTLVAELTSRKNRPLIPAPAVSVWPLGSGSSEYFY
jgi:hypothetical protein